MGAKQSFPRVQLTTDRIFVVTGANRGKNLKFFVHLYTCSIILTKRCFNASAKSIGSCQPDQSAQLTFAFGHFFLYLKEPFFIT